MFLWPVVRLQVTYASRVQQRTRAGASLVHRSLSETTRIAAMNVLMVLAADTGRADPGSASEHHLLVIVGIFSFIFQLRGKPHLLCKYVEPCWLPRDTNAR